MFNAIIDTHLPQRERLIKLDFSTVKILAQRPTHISAVATVLLITKTFTVKSRERERERERAVCLMVGTLSPQNDAPNDVPPFSGFWLTLLKRAK